MAPFGLVQALSTLPPTALLLVKDPGLIGPQLQLIFHVTTTLLLPSVALISFTLNNNHVDLALGPPHGISRQSSSPGSHSLPHSCLKSQKPSDNRKPKFRPRP